MIIMLRHGCLVPLLARFERFDSAKSNLWSNESDPRGSMHRTDPNGHSGCTYIFPDLYRYGQIPSFSPSNNKIVLCVRLSASV